MKKTHCEHPGGVTLPLVEALENRRLLSVALPAAALTTSPATSGAAVSVATTALTGRKIHAEAGQSFEAVIGKITGLATRPAAYTVEGSINWGDGTGASAATFVRQANGSISVLGTHTYANVGTDSITVIVTENPPPGSAAPVLLVGRIHSTADVISSNGGVTVEETAGVPFTAAVGFFSSNLSAQTMTAMISWGDGTTSVGKILALPTADLVGRFEVAGSHTYSQTQSYVVNVIVTTAPPPPVAAPQATPPLSILVANIDSVIDVLPVSPIAAS